MLIRRVHQKSVLLVKISILSFYCHKHYNTIEIGVSEKVTSNDNDRKYFNGYSVYPVYIDLSRTTTYM